jgi:aspartate-semialdehyde dehydrogenase
LAIVGCTGVVGRTFIKVLEERNFPVEKVYMYASSRSAGKTLTFRGNDYVVEELKEDSFDICPDIALFSAGSDVSRQFALLAAAKGCTVVDNSSAWRMDPGVPLVVPEINPEDVLWHKGIIANPNCSTIQSVLPLKPLHDAFGIKRIVYSTYQAVSGTGMAGIVDLENGIMGIKPQKYPHPIAFNCLPHIDDFMDNGYTKEEMKMVNETRKILHEPDLPITATTVRVPVWNGHSVSINVEFNRPFELSEVYERLSRFPGIVIEDDVKNNVYPMPIKASGTDAVYVGRIRRDFSVENGLNLWVVADNIRKGAATNAVQIAELLLKRE